jgi:hypothetical protein
MNAYTGSINVRRIVQVALMLATACLISGCQTGFVTPEAAYTTGSRPPLNRDQSSDTNLLAIFYPDNVNTALAFRAQDLAQVEPYDFKSVVTFLMGDGKVWMINTQGRDLHNAATSVGQIVSLAGMSVQFNNQNKAIGAASGKVMIRGSLAGVNFPGRAFGFYLLPMTDAYSATGVIETLYLDSEVRRQDAQRMGASAYDTEMSNSGDAAKAKDKFNNNVEQIMELKQQVTITEARSIFYQGHDVLQISGTGKVLVAAPNGDSPLLNSANQPHARLHFLSLASYSEDKTGVNPRLSEENRGWPKNGC